MRNSLLRSLAFSGILLVAALPSALAQWRPVGPGPLIGGQSENITSPDGPSPVSGAIESIAVSPTDANIAYVASVNGGVWKSVNAKAASPSWTALTDQALPALSIGSVALSPLDSNVVFAGAGRRSSFAGEGGLNFGIGRSTDGGATWTVVGANIDQSIRTILPTAHMVSGGQLVLVASDAGIFRSVDAGQTYTAVTNGIPTSAISALAGESEVPTRYYAATAGIIYRSDDAGATWAAPANTGFTVVAGARVLLSAHSSAGSSVVYAAVIPNGALTQVYRSVDQGENWTALGAPVPRIFPGNQGSIHGALLADKVDPNMVWISGDRQPDNTELGGMGQFPNVNGANDYSGNIFRNVSGNWELMTNNGANGTSPHSDSRFMIFDAENNILHGCDGGIFKLNNPNLASRAWTAVNGNIQVLEVHNAAYDSFPKNFIEGAQDNGTGFQRMPDNVVWQSASGGDGGLVAADANQTAHAGTSIRYSSSQNFGGFYRRSFDNLGQPTTGQEVAGLMITVGAGMGQTLKDFDGMGIQFIQPFALNAIDQSRLLIGTGNIYESLDRGDTLNNLGSADARVGDPAFSGAPPIAYGGRLNGAAAADVFYVGAGDKIKHRVNVGGAITTISYPGSIVRSLVIDPFNYQRIFVLDDMGAVFTSGDAGANWTNITGNLGPLIGRGHVLALANPNDDLGNASLYAAGNLGVFQLSSPTAAGTWAVASTGLPKVLVWSVHYDQTDRVLTAGTLGRGVYTLGGGAPVPTSAFSRRNHGGVDYDVPLPLVAVDGAVGIEPRIGPNFTMVITFPAPVTVGGVAVTTGTGNATMSVSGAVVTVNLTGVTNAQRIGVTLNGVNAGSGAGNVLIPMGVLTGDTNGNRSVSATDVGQVKAAAASGAVTAGNFRADINAGGSVNATDVAITKASTGQVLP